jgi:hypothetical protein
MFGIECLSTKIAKAPVAVDHNHRGWHSSRRGQLGNVQSHDTLASATRDNICISDQCRLASQNHDPKPRRVTVQIACLIAQIMASGRWYSGLRVVGDRKHSRLCVLFREAAIYYIESGTLLVTTSRNL